MSAAAGSDLTVLKLGGELLEGDSDLSGVAARVASVARPLIVVHGGGREIDEELAIRGVKKRSVDGLRITDQETLAVVVNVLAGRVNTRFVAALVSAGLPAVGITGADSGMPRAEVVPAYRASDGSVVDLGQVGQPVPHEHGTLLETLVAAGLIPVVASIGATAEGRLLNINADTMASRVAMAVGAKRLLLAGTTAGVLDAGKRTIPVLDREAISTLIATGQANAGMVIKLRAALDAVGAGVGRVQIFDGRGTFEPGPTDGTRIETDPRYHGGASGAPAEDAHAEPVG